MFKVYNEIRISKKNKIQDDIILHIIITISTYILLQYASTYFLKKFFLSEFQYRELYLGKSYKTTNFVYYTQLNMISTKIQYSNPIPMFIYQMWWQGRKRRIHYTQSSRKWIFIPTLLFFFVTTTANTCIKMAYLSIEFEYVI